MITMSIMVGSFRKSLRDHLARTIRADFYITAPEVPASRRPERRIDSGWC